MARAVLRRPPLIQVKRPKKPPAALPGRERPARPGDRHTLRRLLPVLLVSGLALAWLAPAAGAHPRAHTAAERVSAAVAGKRTFHLPRRASEIAIYWRGARRAHVWVALSRDGRRFGRFHRVRLDELGPRRPNGNTYGNLIVAGGARVV